MADEIVFVQFDYEPFTSQYTILRLPGVVTDTGRKYECTFCKTVTPSLLFSRSPTEPFPSEHHLTPSSADRIAAAQAGAEKLEKGKKWYEGLVLPGTLDLAHFHLSDSKLGVVFEDEELVHPASV